MCLLLPAAVADAEWVDYAYELSPLKDHWNGLSHEAIYDNRGNDPQPEPAVILGMRVKWREVVVQTYDSSLVVRGEVILQPGQKWVTWLQGLRVLAAPGPGAKPDWSKGHRDADTVVADTVIGADNRFVAKFKLTDFPRPVGSRERFQFGIALPKSTALEERRGTITWDKDQPLLKDSLTRFEVAGPPKPGPTLQLIHAASATRRNRGEISSVGLIRAVNHLHGLGKAEAIAALREYCQQADDGFGVHDIPFDPENIETGDHTVVFWIARLLFEPAEAGERIPPPAIAISATRPGDPDFADWPLDPLELADDIPFLSGHGIGLGGVPEHPLWHLPWIERHCVLRERPLKPADDPLAAADRFLSLPKAQRRNRFGFTQGIRRQAWEMVAQLLPMPEPDEDGDIEFTNEAWQKLRLAAKERRIHWDDDKQEYLTGAAE